MTKTYHVTLKFEDTLVVEAEDETQAVSFAMSEFDPTQDNPEVVEIWSNENE